MVNRVVFDRLFATADVLAAGLLRDAPITSLSSRKESPEEVVSRRLSGGLKALGECKSS